MTPVGVKEISRWLRPQADTTGPRRMEARTPAGVPERALTPCSSTLGPLPGSNSDTERNPVVSGFALNHRLMSATPSGVVVELTSFLELLHDLHTTS